MLRPNRRADSEADLIGTRIYNRFTVLSVLGRGGMGDVYRVRDEHTGAMRALKRLRRERSGERSLALSLFEREYHVLSQLVHPSVVAVDDYAVDEHGAFYTMELLDGVDLRARGRLPYREACVVLRDIASALSVMHSRRWLYRDLSPRNVIYLGENRVKLIDFGAMAPIGLARATVGTPAFVPPEAVQLQSLDARADLYALGALAYFVLTGRNAYPARTFDELRDSYRSAPRPPHRVVSDIPESLSRLVLELLSLDRNARPSSASQVIERLSGVLGDGEEATAGVSSAYLTTPRLIGRDAPLKRARERMVAALRGHGSVLLIEGPPGSGRSRFLDACVLDAKLLGAVVLRGDASDGARGEYGLASALGEQLMAALPELALSAARLRRDLLAHVVPSLRERPPHESGDIVVYERRHLQTALRDWFLAAARNRRIVIAIDDFERVDEPSAAWLAALAHKSERRKLVVVAAARSDAKGSAALALLRATSVGIELDPLTAPQTEALLGSLFGGAANLAAVSRRMHELSGGNPRLLMELAEHLVRRGSARYHAGTWSLAQRLTEDDLPASIDAGLWTRISGLTGAARELVEALALTDPQALPLDSYPLLLGDSARGEVFRALDVLVEAGVLQAEGERYRFVQERTRALIDASLTEPRRRALHGRLAQAVERSGDPVSLPYHLMMSGRTAAAIELLLGLRGSVTHYSDALVQLLQRAVEESERLGLPLRSRLALRSFLVMIIGPLARRELFLQHGEALRAELERASGLSDFAAQPPDLPPAERLRLAIEAALARSAALPEAERPLPPFDAIRELNRTYVSYGAMASVGYEIGLIERLPSLEPFAALSPAVIFSKELCESIAHNQAGRTSTARKLQERLVERLEQPDHCGFDESTAKRLRAGVLYSLGIIDGLAGKPSALARVSELRELPGYRANAARVQVIHHCMQCDIDEARQAERRAELLLLQDGSAQLYPGTGAYSMAIVQWLSDDLDGIKQQMERLRSMAEALPGWQVPYTLNRCHYLRLRGEFDAALALSSELSARAPIGSHVACCWVAASHVMLLALAGRTADAARYGQDAMRACEAQGLVLSDAIHVARCTAEALAQNGEFEAAVALADAAIAQLAEDGVRGLTLGVCYEARARIALAMQDHEAFHRWIERCRNEFARGNYAPLGAKLGRLLQLARSTGAYASEEHGLPLEDDDDDTQISEQFLATVFSRMRECIDARERARCALLLLLEHCEASEGHLYGLIEGQLSHLISLPGDQPPEGVLGLLEQCVEAELRATETTAVSASGRTSNERKPGGPRHYRCMALTSLREGEPVLAAAVALMPGPNFSQPSTDLLASLAASLLENDDVDPVTRLD